MVEGIILKKRFFLGGGLCKNFFFIVWGWVLYGRIRVWGMGIYRVYVI